jgi:hypothetical protein
MRQNKIFLICIIYIVISVIFFGLLFHWQGIISDDTDNYINIAQNLLQRQSFSIDGITPDYSRTLGYPLFLALVYALGGNNTLLIFIQILLATLEIYLFYRILLIAGTLQKHALVGAGLLLFNLTSYQYSWNISPDFLFGFLLTLALYFLVKYFQDKRWFSNFALFTLVFNYALLVRPILVYFNMLVIVVLIIFWSYRKISGKCPFIFALCFLLCWGGWSYRNYKHSGVFIYSTISNYNMLKYNCPPITAYLEKISEKSSAQYHDQKFAQKYPETAELNNAQLSLLQKEYGLEFIKSHPFVFGLLSLLGLFGTLLGPSKTFIFGILSLIPAYFISGLYITYLVGIYILYLAGLVKNYKKSLNLIQSYIFLLSSYLVIPGAIMANSRFRAPFFTLLVLEAVLNSQRLFAFLAKPAPVTSQKFQR